MPAKSTHTKPSQLTVAVTGASGYLASRLIQTLSRDDRVDRILGFDVRPPEDPPSKLLFDSVDVRDEALGARFAGVDVVIHLAFIMDPIHDEAKMRDVNVRGSQNVFDRAGAAGVKKIIYTSSATAYGAHPDNDVPLTEESPLRANLDFSYPAHKLEVEYIAKDFRAKHPKTKVVVFRPAIVFGPNVDNAWSHLLEAPVMVGIKGYSPPLQFVHEDDVAEALAFATFANLDGAFNLAPSDWVESERLLEILGRRRRDLPEDKAWAFSQKMWSMGVGEAPPGMLHYVMHPWVVSPDRLEQAGFRCSHSAEATFTEVAEAARGHVRLGRTRVSRSGLARGAAVGVGLAGAAAAVRGLRRRRPA